jgi:hypothetical protein
MMLTTANIKEQLRNGMILAFLLSVLSAAPPDTYDIVFYDASSRVVGAGSFHIDPVQPVCVEVLHPDDCVVDERRQNKGLIVTALMDHFEVDLLGQHWHLHNPGVTWWTDGNRPPGQQRIYRGELYGATPSWCFGNIEGMSASLSVAFDQASVNEGKGR